MLKSKNAEFHSYTQKKEKTLAFVLNGLDDETTPEELEEELKAEDVNITKIYRMRNKRTLLLVITKGDVKLKVLQEHIKTLSYTRVFWERYYNKK